MSKAYLFIVAICVCGFLLSPDASGQKAEQMEQDVAERPDSLDRNFDRNNGEPDGLEREEEEDRK